MQDYVTFKAVLELLRQVSAIHKIHLMVIFTLDSDVNENEEEVLTSSESEG